MSDLLRSLFQHWIDYAGRYPPASLPLASVLETYTKVRRSPAAWFLHRLVLSPDDRHTLESDPQLAGMVDMPVPIPVSLVIGTAWDRVAASVERDRSAQVTRCVSFEGRWSDQVEWDEVAARVGGRTVYVELSADDLRGDRIERLGRAGLGAKFRCGGVRAEQIPPAVDVARFMSACHESGVGYKLTAGLHHLDPGRYRLTYAPDSPAGSMHGFLAVALAGLHFDESPSAVDEGVRILEEARRAEVGVEEDSIAWRGRRWNGQACRRLRRLLHAVGSCSFDEPYEELRAWGA